MKSTYILIVAVLCCCHDLGISYKAEAASSPSMKNLVLEPGVLISASSKWNDRRGAERIGDGNLQTSWFTVGGNAANLGSEPWVQVSLPGDGYLEEIRVFGNREPVTEWDEFDRIAILEMKLELIDPAGTVIATETLALTGEFNDGRLALDPSIGPVRSVVATSIADLSNAPGFAEIEVYGRIDKLNLMRQAGVEITASSEWNERRKVARVGDGNLWTSWFSTRGDAANLGAGPWVRTTLPGNAFIDEVRIFGDREPSEGSESFAITEMKLEFVGEDGTVVASEALSLGGDFNDGKLIFNQPIGPIRTVVATSVADVSAAPGLAEIEIYGKIQNEPGPKLTIEIGQNGLPRLRFQGSETEFYQLEVSTDLREWTAVEGGGSVSGRIDIFAGAVTSIPMGFYRVATSEDKSRNDGEFVPPWLDDF